MTYNANGRKIAVGTSVVFALTLSACGGGGGGVGSTPLRLRPRPWLRRHHPRHRHPLLRHHPQRTLRPQNSTDPMGRVTMERSRPIRRAQRVLE